MYLLAGAGREPEHVTGSRDIPGRRSHIAECRHKTMSADYGHYVGGTSRIKWRNEIATKQRCDPAKRRSGLLASRRSARSGRVDAGRCYRARVGRSTKSNARLIKRGQCTTTY
ncbi:hypothetical protein LSAT2_020651 [Lamellibrachia satsuma]|nr:hypothetical protein LSAT2_020651 [Lamellibrachia satsuma]